MAKVSPSQQHISSQEKSYGVRPAFSIFVVFCLLFAICLLFFNLSWIVRWVSFLLRFPQYWLSVVLIAPRGPEFFPVIVGLFLLILSLCMLAALPKVRIFLDSYGITIHTWGYYCYAPWSAIRGTTSRFIYGGLLLEHSALTSISLDEGKRRGLAVIKRRWPLIIFLGSELDRIFLVPAITGLDWRSSEVGVALRQYIPRI